MTDDAEPAVGPAPTPGADAVMGVEWWRRAVGGIVDLVLVSIGSSVVASVLGLSPYEIDPVTGELTDLDAGQLSIMNVVLALTYVVYSVAGEGGRRGQSLGKRLVRVRLVDAGTGANLGPGRVALRRLVYMSFWFLFFLPGMLNALSPLWDPRRQSWHDRALGAVVVPADWSGPGADTFGGGR